VRLTYSGGDTAESKWGVASGMNDADSGSGTQTQGAPRFEVTKVSFNAALVTGRIDSIKLMLRIYAVFG
jgi:hypothetical protein